MFGSNNNNQTFTMIYNIYQILAGSLTAFFKFIQTLYNAE